MQKKNDQKIIRGIVKQFNAQTQVHANGSMLTWTFRVIGKDEYGNELPPVQVEMRSYKITGSIADGDEVEIEGSWAPPAVLSVSKVFNHTTNAEVTSRQTKGCGSAVLFIVLIGLAVFFLL